MHYVYDLDGFRLVETGMELYDGDNVMDEHGTSPEAAGWTHLYSYGTDPETRICVYHQEEDPDRGLYVVVRDLAHRIYNCIVTPRAWPVFYRAELRPILQARDIAAMSFGVSRLVDMATPKSAETPPVETPPVVTPPVVTPPGKGNSK